MRELASRRATGRALTAALAACVAAAALGCASPPPSRSPGFIEPGFSVLPSAPRPASAAAPTPRPPPAPAAPVVAVPPPAPPAVPPAVAAQFPEPAVAFATPAFEPGRQTFTGDDELRAILFGLERASTVGERATSIKVLEIGSSQGGTPIEALAFTRALPPPDAAASSAAPSPVPAHRPTVLLVAGQHGDEPAGTEALIVVAQDLAAGRLEAVLDRVDVVLLPRANPDGAARFERDAADGTDINRDHVLLRTPEAQAQARLVADLQPIVVADLHEYPVHGAFAVKFGVLPRADVLLQYATTANLPPFITRAAEEWFRQPLLASLKGAGLNGDWYFTTSADPNDRKLSMGGVGAQIARNADGLKNAVSLLIETRGGGLGRVDLKRRVLAQVVAVKSVLASASVHAADLVKLKQYVERETVSLACHGDVIVDAAPTPSEYAVSALDPQSGAVKRLNVAWDTALVLRSLRTRPRPCGYWLAESEGDAVARLRMLGVEVQRLDESSELRGETYREVAREPVAGDAASNAGSATRLRVRTAPSLLDLAAGGYYVSLEQPLANLVVAALEPESPSSFAANGVVAKVDSEARILLRPQAAMTRVP